MTWLSAVLKQEDREKEREKPESAGGTLMFSLKRKTDLFSCQWKLGGLEIPKDGLL